MPDLDPDAIRRAAERGDPALPAQVLALCDELEHRQQMYFILLSERRSDQEAVDTLLAGMDALLRYVNGDACEYGDGPPCPGDDVVEECRYCQATRTRSGGGVLLSLLDAARAWVDAVGRCDGVVAAEQALMAAIARCG